MMDSLKFAMYYLERESTISGQHLGQLFSSTTGHFEFVKDGSGDSNRDSWSDDSDRSERADYRRGGLDNEGFI